MDAENRILLDKILTEYTMGFNAGKIRQNGDMAQYKKEDKSVDIPDGSSITVPLKEGLELRLSHLGQVTTVELLNKGNLLASETITGASKRHVYWIQVHNNKEISLVDINRNVERKGSNYRRPDIGLSH